MPDRRKITAPINGKLGGRKPIPRRCPVCLQPQPGAGLARTHHARTKCQPEILHDSASKTIDNQQVEE